MWFASVCLTLVVMGYLSALSSVLSDIYLGNSGESGCDSVGMVQSWALAENCW